MMQSISSGVGPKTLGELDIVSDGSDITQEISLERSVVRSHTACIRPVNVQSDGPFELKIWPQQSQYIQLNSHRLYVRCKITKEDGSDITEEDPIAFINNAGNSLFSNIDILINDLTISQLTNTHTDYKGYLENLLSYDPQASDLEAGGWAMDNDKWDDVDNNGHCTRKEWTDGSLFGGRTSREFMISLPSDFLQVRKMLPPGFAVTIKLTRNPDNKCLYGPVDAGYKVKIEDMRMYVKYMELDPSLEKAHNSVLMKGGLVYHLSKTLITTSSVGIGMTNCIIPQIFNGTHPKSILIAFTDQKSYDGAMTKNPYYFAPFDVASIHLGVGGARLPSDPYSLDFPAGLCVRAYRDLLDAIGMKDDDGRRLTLEQYRNGCTLFGFDLTKDSCAGFHCHDPDSGVISLEVNFHKALTAPLKILAVAVYDNYIKFESGYVTVHDRKP